MLSCRIFILITEQQISVEDRITVQDWQWWGPSIHAHWWEGWVSNTIVWWGENHETRSIAVQRKRWSCTKVSSLTNLGLGPARWVIQSSCGREHRAGWGLLIEQGIVFRLWLIPATKSLKKLLSVTTRSAFCNNCGNTGGKKKSVQWRPEFPPCLNPV